MQILSLNLCGLIFIISISLGNAFLHAQDSLQTHKIKFDEEPKRNTIYLELAGNIAGIYSVNYDYLLFPNLSVRLGTGYWIRTSDGSDYGKSYTYTEKIESLGFCTSISYLVNFPASPHHIELGIGGAFWLDRSSITSVIPPQYANKVLPSIIISPKSLVGIIGYRLQPQLEGFNFRVVINPGIHFFDGISPQTNRPYDIWPAIWGGISFGYTF